MTLTIKQFTCLPMLRDDARIMLSSMSAPPEKIDFSEIESITHCFADELFRNLPASAALSVSNASPYVQRIVSAVRRP
jgi:hypothetical protein